MAVADGQTAVVAVAPAGLRPGQLVLLVGNGLTERGFDVRFPAGEDHLRLAVERWGGRCGLSVGDSGYAELSLFPWSDANALPAAVANAAAFLLSETPGQFRREDIRAGRPGLPFLAAVGMALRARGFDVGLDVWEDDDLLEVSADIVATNPVAGQRARVRISADGSLEWECDYPFFVAQPGR